MVRNAGVESEKKIRTIKAAVQPLSGSRHPKTVIIIIAGKPSTQMSGLGSSFQYEEINSMLAETME